MFKKPFSVKSNTNIRNSERKKLFASFPSDSVDKFPSKAVFSICKVINFQQREVNVYFCERTPVFFNISDDANIYPTLYFLWQFPAAIPILLIHDQVFEFIQNGADLMLPGVFIHPDYKFPEFPVNSPVSIGIYSGKHGTVSGPVAVGVSLMSSQEMRACGMKGRGVTVHHVIHDHLWDEGAKGNPPIIQLETIFQSATDEVEEDLGSTIESVLQLNQEPEEEKVEEKEEKEENEDSVEENDEKVLFFKRRFLIQCSQYPWT
uniref:PUA domain-containing protein n=1 Tax=Bursaphelenchus xylophilus TaxID=6326 RepID=A0A1I7SSF2_BURXY